MSKAAKVLFIIAILIINVSNIFSQKVYNQDESGRLLEPYQFAWVGGMDAIQFCEVDLNMDGIKDLLAFDRRGNRKLCFVNKGTNNMIDYVYAPQFASNLPDFYDWVIFKDYNMDGKNDIFTYSPGYGSMMVYKNTSDGVLKFERVVYPYLKTLLPGGYVNLFVTNADYPGIADIDNDGDLDILTFEVLGSFVGMHKNMSMEKYGIPDSLDFEHATYCWGKFAESDESNELYFDTCMSGTLNTRYGAKRSERHTGSTLLLHDFDGNGLTDLLLGDVDYPKIFALYNNGSPEEAYITDVDTTYPVITNMINMFSMPAAAYIDVNNDNLKDLLISPFDPGIVTSQNKESSLLFINSGSNNNPVYESDKVSFLQSEMIDVGSGAYPVVFDWDGDGLNDLFVGNYGYYEYSYYDNYFLHSVYKSKITYFKNVGSINKPVFELLDDDFANLGRLNKIGLVPTFGDINGDGSVDVLVGNSDGKIIYVNYNKIEDSFDVVTESYLNIDVGDFSVPQLFDLTKDGNNDLVIGEKAGNINYYENMSSTDVAEFSFITDSLGKINVTDYLISWDGFSTPSFFIDKQNNTGLLVGSEQGEIFYFTDIDGNLDGKFTESDELQLLLDTTDINIDRGMRTSATICNLYLDNKLEMIAGNYSGGLEYFNGAAEVMYDGVIENIQESIHIYPVPAQEIIFFTLPKTNESAKIEMYNILGIKVKTQLYVGNKRSVELNISDISDGVYVITTSIGNRIFKNKIIVKK